MPMLKHVYSRKQHNVSCLIISGYRQFYCNMECVCYTFYILLLYTIYSLKLERIR